MKTPCMLYPEVRVPILTVFGSVFAKLLILSAIFQAYPFDRAFFTLNFNFEDFLALEFISKTVLP